MGQADEPGEQEAAHARDGAEVEQQFAAFGAVQEGGQLASHVPDVVLAQVRRGEGGDHDGASDFHPEAGGAGERAHAQTLSEEDGMLPPLLSRYARRFRQSRCRGEEKGVRKGAAVGRFLAGKSLRAVGGPRGTATPLSLTAAGRPRTQGTRRCTRPPMRRWARIGRRPRPGGTRPPSRCSGHVGRRG